MTFFALIMALIQMNGSTLKDSAYYDKFFDLVLQNLHSIQGVFGWVALIAIILGVVFLLFSFLTGGNGIEAAVASLGCLAPIVGVSVLYWLVGFVHIWIGGFLAANITPEGVLNPGFWILLVLLVLFGWS